jgi:hypothetical protein
LNSCEAIFKELYSSDIGHLKLSIENVFNTLSMFQTFSCYSFDKSLITEILLTCLNQIVISSINYLTNNNKVVFWEQSKQIMIEKLVECISLKDHIFNCYNKMQNILIIKNCEPFEVFFVISFDHVTLFFDRIKKVCCCIKLT